MTVSAATARKRREARITARAFGRLLKALRKARGWTQVDGASLLGMHQSDWSELERAKQPPTIDEVETIALLFDQNPIEMFATLLMYRTELKKQDPRRNMQERVCG